MAKAGSMAASASSAAFSDGAVWTIETLCETLIDAPGHGMAPDNRTEERHAQAYRRDARRGRTGNHGRVRAFGDGSDPRCRDRRSVGAVRRLLQLRYVPRPCRPGICG